MSARKRFCPFVLAIAIVAGIAGSAVAGPVEVWPAQPATLDPKTVDAAAGGLPAELQPAVGFQKLFLQALSSAPATAWRAGMERLANTAGTEPVGQAVQQVARAWLARALMLDLDTGLRAYYAKHARFPETLEQAGKLIPDSLRVDPWGDQWVYALKAPTGFSKLTNQRYQVTAKKLPQILPLKLAIKNRASPAQAWKITPKNIAGQRALEFVSPVTRGAALIQPGATVDGCTLVYIGEKWALMASSDQLFAVTY